MTTRAVSPPKKPDRIADSVVEKLLMQIFSETHGPGARLPAERELALSLGASRVSIREAFQRLEGWHVIEIRQSGAIVRRRRYWSLAVLPTFVHHCHGIGDREAMAQVVLESLDMRRLLLTQMVARHVARLRPGSLDGAREALLRAWAERGDFAAFMAFDIEVDRRVLEAAGMRSSLWLLNNLTEANIEFVFASKGKLRIPEGYVDAHRKLFEALENQDPAKARKIADRYFETHDAEIVRYLGLSGAT